ncbi:hypothetical protein DVH24_021508 [Malus domestica]|uniref:Uncharacterized protein n=1 Tax=Malus domestica TaxID=3750 RepID=A0A498JX65_MALDO|nr:hypothetical protein DVH24_021508 [Malus domestica]
MKYSRMSRLITRRRSVINAPPALSPSTSSVSVQLLNARWPHWRCSDSEPSVHNSSSSSHFVLKA